MAKAGKKSPKKRTNRRGKIVVLIMVRGPKNEFIAGNKMRVFSVAHSTVDEVADGISVAVQKVRKANVKK